MAFENRYSSRKTIIRVKKFLPVVAVCMLFVWFSGQMPGKGGQQETEQWSVESHDRTNFPLVGRHRTVSCRDCHLDGVFEGTPTACEVCHWERRQDDRYELRLGIHCAECHVPFAWKHVAPNKWNHESATGYPLEGVHRTLDCVECHSSGQYKGLPSVCVFCHLDDYLSASDPDHKQLGFHTDCEVCHGTDAVSWENVTVFDHSFPINSGRHAKKDCADCHVAANYRDYSCLNCHAHDKTQMDNRHRDVPGYSFSSQSCYGCHPEGRE